MPPQPTTACWIHFTPIPRGTHETSRIACKHCSHETIAGSVQRAMNHLHACPGYLRKKKKNSMPQEEIKLAVPGQIHSITQQEKQNLDDLAAAAILEEGLPFNTFEHPAVLRFFKAVNPAYTPPDRRQIAGASLEEIIQDVKNQMSVLEGQVISQHSSRSELGLAAPLEASEERPAGHYLTGGPGAVVVGYRKGGTGRTYYCF